MPYKDPVKQKLAQQRYYKENQVKYKETSRRKTRLLRRLIQDIKNSTPCTDCKIQYPHYVMDFDHVNGKKFNNISDIHLFTERTLREEVAKCDLVCSNCHRHRTYMRITKT